MIFDHSCSFASILLNDVGYLNRILLRTIHSTCDLWSYHLFVSFSRMDEVLSTRVLVSIIHCCCQFSACDRSSTSCCKWTEKLDIIILRTIRNHCVIWSFHQLSTYHSEYCGVVEQNRPKSCSFLIWALTMLSILYLLFRVLEGSRPEPSEELFISDAMFDHSINLASTVPSNAG